MIVSDHSTVNQVLCKTLAPVMVTGVHILFTSIQSYKFNHKKYTATEIMHSIFEIATSLKIHNIFEIA